MTLEFQNVSVKIGAKPILTNVSFHVGRGEFVALVGQNGAGKTTLLRSIIRLVNPTSGVIKLGGKELGKMSQGSIGDFLSYVPQSLQIGPDVLVSQFFQLQEKSKVFKLLADLGVVNFFERTFVSLSGGERQRVLLASALAREPRLLLLDELTQYADVLTTSFLGEFLTTYCKKEGLSILAVSHDMNWIERFTCRALLLTNNSIAPLALGIVHAS